MATRTSMVQLISLVRELINDRAEVDQNFLDEQIQSTLDGHRWRVSKVLLVGLPTYEDGEIKYYEWQSDEMYWESSVRLTDASNVILTPLVADPINGFWQFEVTQTGVYALGWVYDVYAAAADLLEMWLSKTSQLFDFSADGASYSLSQKSKGLSDLAAKYRAKQRVRMIPQVRHDCAAY